MNYKISKELFKAVMKDDIFNNSGDWGQLTEEKYINKSLKEIDYNRLFFDCKKWALGQGYEIFTSGIKCSVYEISKGWIIDQLESTSEQQVVFDACQCILNNKDRQ